VTRGVALAALAGALDGRTCRRASVPVGDREELAAGRAKLVSAAPVGDGDLREAERVDVLRADTLVAHGERRMQAAGRPQELGFELVQASELARRKLPGSGQVSRATYAEFARLGKSPAGSAPWKKRPVPLALTPAVARPAASGAAGARACSARSAAPRAATSATRACFEGTGSSTALSSFARIIPPLPEGARSPGLTSPPSSCPPPAPADRRPCPDQTQPGRALSHFSFRSRAARRSGKHARDVFFARPSRSPARLPEHAGPAQFRRLASNRRRGEEAAARPILPPALHALAREGRARRLSRADRARRDRARAPAPLTPAPGRPETGAFFLPGASRNGTGRFGFSPARGARSELA